MWVGDTQTNRVVLVDTLCVAQGGQRVFLRDTHVSDRGADPVTVVVGMMMGVRLIWFLAAASLSPPPPGAVVGPREACASGLKCGTRWEVWDQM